MMKVTLSEIEEVIARCVKYDDTFRMKVQGREVVRHVFGDEVVKEGEAMLGEVYLNTQRDVDVAKAVAKMIEEVSPSKSDSENKRIIDVFQCKLYCKCLAYSILGLKDVSTDTLRAALAEQLATEMARALKRTICDELQKVALKQILKESIGGLTPPPGYEGRSF